MSVYIPGIEMPTNCYGCSFFTQVDYWNKDDEADILSKCKRTGEFTWESVNGYLPNCPLVNVPPHGRLIDADVLFDFILNIYKTAQGDARKAYRDVLDTIVAAGDVIPADKEGEG